MRTTRWWDLAFAGTLVIMASVAWFLEDSDLARIGALLTLGVIGVCYVAFGRRGIGPEGYGGGNAHASVAFRTVVIVGCGVAAAFDGNMASLQALAFPVLWALTESYWRCIALSAALAVSVGIGLATYLGGGYGAILQASLVAGIGLVFAVALGSWITRIARDGETQARLLAELTAAQGELGTMHRYAGSAAERERLAREIHDTIAQDLTSLVMLAQRTRNELSDIPDDSEAGPAAEAARISLELIETTARESLTDARALVASMTPVQVGDSTLSETVTRLAARFERETGIQVDTDVAAPQLDRDLEVVLLRCVQEGLANVRKHSRAGRAAVIMRPDDDEVTLEVRDDGRGIDPQSEPAETGFGLAGIRDRLALVGGRLEVTAGASRGTVLRVSVPLRREATGGDGATGMGATDATRDGTDATRIESTRIGTTGTTTDAARQGPRPPRHDDPGHDDPEHDVDAYPDPHQQPRPRGTEPALEGTS